MAYANHARNRRSGKKHVLCDKIVQITWFGNPNLKPKHPSHPPQRLEKKVPTKILNLNHDRH